MKAKLLILVLFFSIPFFSQDTTVYDTISRIKYERIKPISPVFKQFEFNTSLVINDNDDNPYTDGDESKPQFLPNGLGFKYGIGIQKNKWLGISMHTGIDWKANEKLVAIPIYGNLRFSPFFRDDSSRLVLNLGYGRGYALGRGDMQGRYRRINLCFESDEDFGIMAEIAGYDFDLHYQPTTVLFNIGLYFRDF